MLFYVLIFLIFNTSNCLIIKNVDSFTQFKSAIESASTTEITEINIKLSFTISYFVKTPSYSSITIEGNNHEITSSSNITVSIDSIMEVHNWIGIGSSVAFAIVGDSYFYNCEFYKFSDTPLYVKENGYLEISKSFLFENQATNGGSIFAEGWTIIVIEESEISENKAIEGGGIYSLGSIYLYNSIIEFNEASDVFK